MSTQVFLINLEKDRDRLGIMTAQMAALSIPFERVEAVYGTKMPEWIKPYFLDQAGNIASDLLPRRSRLLREPHHDPQADCRQRQARPRA